MQYNFDEIIIRENAAKVEESVRHFGTKDIIPLWIADMDFRTAQPIIDAIKARADQGVFGYTYRPDAYFESVIRWQKRRNGYTPTPDKMAFSPGVIPAMRLYLKLFTQPGDKILIQEPVYHPFHDIVDNSERTLLINPLRADENNHYTVDLEDFEAKAKSGAKCFMLCNPHNPVGRAWRVDELKAMGDICVRYGVEILSDEIHSDLMLWGHKHQVMANISPEIAALTSTFTAPSKTFNLAGLQVSTAIFNSVAHQEAYVTELRNMDNARNSSFNLVAAMAALNEGEEWLEQMLAYVEGNMKLIQDFCRDHIPQLRPNNPEATYLNWIDARALGMDDNQLKAFFVEKAGVAFSMGAGFGQGGSGFVRFNTASPRSRVTQALEQIKKAVDAL